MTRLGLATWLRSAWMHGLWIGLWSGVGLFGTFYSPFLLDSPVALMLLSPRAVFVALAAPHLDLVLFVALGTARLSVTDASYFVCGKRATDTGAEPDLGRSDAGSGSKRGRLRSVVRSGSDRLCHLIDRRPHLAGVVLFCARRVATWL